MKYSYRILVIFLMFNGCLSKEGCRLYMQIVCIEFKGVVIKKGQERYRTLRVQTDKGEVKLPMPAMQLWDNVQVGDSIYKIGCTNRCRIVKVNKSSQAINYVDEETYKEQSAWWGDCTSNPAYKTDNPNPYGTPYHNVFFPEITSA